MFKWIVKNKNHEIIASGTTENYSDAMIKCGSYMQKNPNTSERKPGYTSDIKEIGNSVSINQDNKKNMVIE